MLQHIESIFLSFLLMGFILVFFGFLSDQKFLYKGAYIMYLGGEPKGFTNFSKKKKKFVPQETRDLNLSWPSNFFGRYFMGPPINFSFLFKIYL